MRAAWFVLATSLLVLAIGSSGMAQEGGTEPAEAIEVSVAQLERAPAEWNGREVEITGEVVGDYGIRRSEVWIQVNDDDYVYRPLLETGEPAGSNSGIGVRLSPDLVDVERWGPPGGYRTRGPVVRIAGVFRYAWAEEGGDTFIEAVGVTLVEPARPLPAPPPDWTLIVVGTAAGVMGAVSIGYLRWRKVNPEGSR
jgi:hypothetical protein